MSALREQNVNNGSSTLSAAITSTGATTFTVASASSFPSTGNWRAIIDNEIVLVTAVSGTTLTCTRGAEGTTPATHANGAAVTAIVTVGSVQAYGRDNSPFFDGSQPAFSLQDASGNTLTKSSFTQYNVASQVGTPTVADQDRRITIGMPKSSGGPSSTEGLTVLAHSAPGTPYSVTLGIHVGVIGAGGSFSLVTGFRESSSGKSVLARIPFFYSGDKQLNINTFTNEGTIGFVSSPDNIISGPLLWFKLNDDGTNLNYYWSIDGVNWIQVYTQARTANFTSHPDQVVWGCGSNNPPFDNYASLVSWFGA